MVSAKETVRKREGEREKERESDRARKKRRRKKSEWKTCIKVHVRLGPGELPGCPELGFSLYEIQHDVRVASPFDKLEEYLRRGKEREREREENALWQSER